MARERRRSRGKPKRKSLSVRSQIAGLTLTAIGTAVGLLGLVAAYRSVGRGVNQVSDRPLKDLILLTLGGEVLDEHRPMRLVFGVPFGYPTKGRPGAASTLGPVAPPSTHLRAFATRLPLALVNRGEKTVHNVVITITMSKSLCLEPRQWLSATLVGLPPGSVRRSVSSSGDTFVFTNELKSLDPMINAEIFQPLLLVDPGQPEDLRKFVSPLSSVNIVMFAENMPPQRFTTELAVAMAEDFRMLESEVETDFVSGYFNERYPEPSMTQMFMAYPHRTILAMSKRGLNDTGASAYAFGLNVPIYAADQLAVETKSVTLRWPGR